MVAGRRKCLDRNNKSHRLPIGMVDASIEESAPTACRQAVFHPVVGRAPATRPPGQCASFRNRSCNGVIPCNRVTGWLNQRQNLDRRPVTSFPSCWQNQDISRRADRPAGSMAMRRICRRFIKRSPRRPPSDGRIVKPSFGGVRAMAAADETLIVGRRQSASSSLAPTSG
jgi:hypothetical protein